MAGKQLNDHIGVELPSRVLSLEAVDLGIIKLLESGGSIGRYVALSYCWGHPDRHPPKTTRTNYAERKAGIAISELPPVFKDVITLARSLGINYVWIDSLCIIQDDIDLEDWKKESEKMGGVFQNALLVVAAAGARDPYDGLLSVIPEHSIEVPFYKNGDTRAGVFHVGISTHEKKPSDLCHLRSRAWAFQEWHLARRILFCRPGGVSWFCRTRSSHDSEDREDSPIDLPRLSLGDTQNWLSMLQDYSHLTSITNVSDRLPAMQGLGNEVAGIRGHVYHLGVLADDLPKQLLWCCHGIIDEHKACEDLLARCQPNLPSWCWASIDRGTRFFDSAVRMGQFEESFNIASASLDEARDTVVISGVLYRGWIGLNEVDALSQPIEAIQPGFTTWQTAEALFDLWSFPKKEFPLTRTKNGTDLWGIVTVDFRPYLGVFVLPLVSSPRKADDAKYVEKLLRLAGIFSVV